MDFSAYSYDTTIVILHGSDQGRRTGGIKGTEYTGPLCKESHAVDSSSGP